MASSVTISPAKGNPILTTQAGFPDGFDAIDDRRFWGAGLREGILNKGDWKVTSTDPDSLAVEIAVPSEGAIVEGDDVAAQGLYYIAPHSSTITLDIDTADASDPRIDSIYLVASDTTESAASDDEATVEVQKGTPTTGATLANRNGAPSEPDSALLLADVLVPASASSVGDSEIGAPKDPSDWSAGSVAGAPPQYALGRPADYLPAARLSSTDTTNTAGSEEKISVSDSGGADFDLDGAESGGSFVCQTPGLYEVGAFTSWQEGPAYTAVKVNGTEVERDQSGEGPRVGDILVTGRQGTIPGCLDADGSAVSRTTYSELFDKIGTQFGVGDGSSTFNLPDYQDKFIKGEGSDAVGDTGGEAQHTLTESELPAHDHTISSHSHDVEVSGGTAKVELAGASGSARYVVKLDGSGLNLETDSGGPGSTNNAGGGSAHENRPPYQSARVLIKAEPDSEAQAPSGIVALDYGDEVELYGQHKTDDDFLESGSRLCVSWAGHRS